MDAFGARCIYQRLISVFTGIARLTKIIVRLFLIAIFFFSYVLFHHASQFKKFPTHSGAVRIASAANTRMVSIIYAVSSKA